jgi:hypothetical protein
MSLAIIDAREWQNVFDLRTGARVTDDSPVLKMVREVQAQRPYPGDLNSSGNSWVTDTALDLIDRYDPSFVFLTYAQQFFSGRYSIQTEKEWADAVTDLYYEVERFANISGFTPIIIGTGDMTPFINFIDVTQLQGLVLATHWSARYAGLHEPSAGDLKYLQGVSEIERIVPRDEFLRLFPDSHGDPSRVPEYLLVAREGHMFRTVGGAFRRVRRVPANSFCIPVATELGEASSLTGIRGLIDSNIGKRKIALVMVEGVGLKDFPWACQRCDNGRDWFYYEPGDGQYLTISTGRHQVFEYPSGYKYFEEDAEKKEFPFSGYFRSVPEDTLAGRYDVKSIAVGNRSMFMHMATGTDISVECFARNLFNQGTMAVIHRKDKL